MGWIAQAYEGTVHIVPDDEPAGTERHVLAADCWCQPVKDPEVAMWSHRDECERIFAAGSAPSADR